MRSILSIDWQGLDRLRSMYFSDKEKILDYWQSEKLLSDYHDTLGQRILFKWQNVLSYLDGKNILPLKGQKDFVIKDWGCGTGVASLAFLAYCKPSGKVKLVLSDRSQAAMSFARKKVEEACREACIEGPESKASADVLLVSHVLSEMGKEEEACLLEEIRKAKYVIWLDAGTKAVSRRLSKARDALLAGFDVLAPCTHQMACGMLEEGNEQHWCHFFGDVPPLVFQSAFWREFSKKLKIDLRSLPMSFLVMAKKEVGVDGPLAGEKRIIGRVAAQKGRCHFYTCDSLGVRKEERQKREDKKAFKSLCQSGFCATL